MDHDTSPKLLGPASVREMVQAIAESEDQGCVARSRISRLFAGLLDRLGLLYDYPAA